MKRLKTLTIAVGLLLCLASCSRSPVGKAIDIMDNAIEKIEKADDPLEAIGFLNQMKSDLAVIDAAHKNYQPTEAEAKQISDKLNEVTRAYLKKTAGDSDVATEIIDKLMPQE